MISERLDLRLTWAESANGHPVRSMARFAVFVDDQPVWPVWGDPECGLEIYCDDLLSYLAEFWQPLMLRQTYPVPAAIDRPSHLRAEADRIWGGLPEVEVERQEDAVAAFEDAHNLPRCFGGQFDLPPLWLFRQSNSFLVETSDRLLRTRFQPTARALTLLGDTIADRLGRIPGNRWARLIEHWQNRDAADPDILLAWATGQPRNVAAALRATGYVPSSASVSEVAHDDDELRIAARMSGALPLHEIEQLLRRAADIEARSTPELEEFSRHALKSLTPAVLERRPYEQGVEVARWIREKLGLGLYRRSEPLLLLFSKLQVFTRFEAFGPPNLDAVAIWGRRYGPGVLLNLNSHRLVQTAARGSPAKSGAARVTAAHELCHLLLDREQALGAVDMVNGRMALSIEQRARAFAAAFMLPGEAAVHMWEEDGGPRTLEGIKAILQRLTRRFGVTSSVAAWQLEHGLKGQAPDVVLLLDQISPHRRVVG